MASRMAGEGNEGLQGAGKVLEVFGEGAGFARPPSPGSAGSLNVLADHLAFR